MDLNEEIAKVAYELYERDGKKHGKDKEHWAEAEAIVKARQTAEEKKAAPRKATPAPAKPKPAAAKTPEPAKQKEAAPKSATPASPGRAEKPAAKERTK